ncbi:unnamed protein product [Coregonus sp. 'balchen']|nr:unnamed protein product [Coregonus sp. 'balchen']
MPFRTLPYWWQYWIFDPMKLKSFNYRRPRPIPEQDINCVAQTCRSQHKPGLKTCWTKPVEYKQVYKRGNAIRLIRDILRQLKDTPQVAAKEPPSESGTKKEPEEEAVIEGEKLHSVVPPVATKDSEAPSRTGPQNRKWRKGKTLEEKGYTTQGKQNLYDKAETALSYRARSRGQIIDRMAETVCRLCGESGCN